MSKIFAHKKIYFSKIESTNDYALKNLEDITDKTVIFSGTQTKGRGRNRRFWHSDKGNLFASLVLKPQLSFRELHKITAFVHYTAIVLTEVLKKFYKIDALIKWPNDIFVNRKKIAGILIETVVNGENLQGIVIGIGVNLNMQNESLKKIGKPATSLNILTGTEINKDEFLKYFLEEFFLRYDKFLKQGFSLIRGEYKRQSIVLGKEVCIINHDKKYSGLAHDINKEGQLVLKCPDKTITINTGDIVFL